MKRIWFLTGLLIFSLYTFAQVEELEEMTVHSPLFIAMEDGGLANYKSLDEFIVNEINATQYLDEGVVEVLFTVNADGSVSDIKIENSVSESNDDAVKSSIKKTSGNWKPGLVDGLPVAMEKRIYVNFIGPDGVSLVEQARAFMHDGMRLYYSALNTSGRFDLSKEKAIKKANRKYNRALYCFEEAKRYRPQEASIPFWQACIYENKGDSYNYKEKLEEFNEMTVIQKVHDFENVDIALK